MIFLAEGVRGNIDFLTVSETKIDETFLRVNSLLVVLLHQLDLTEQIKKGLYLNVLYI